LQNLNTTLNGQASLGTTSGVVTIDDNDTASLSVAAATSVTEQGGAQNIVVTLTTSDGAGGTATLGAGITLTADVVDAGGGSASSGTDYTALGTQTVTFNPGDGNGATENASITPSPDPDVEGNETVNVTLQNLNTTLNGQASLGTTSGVVTILDDSLDFGDAPDGVGAAPNTYPTLLANNGARHVSSTLFLGASIDSESDGQPSSTAAGDDTGGVDDENGVTLPGLVARIGAVITVTASLAGQLDAWIDFNRDGDWGDAGEQIATSLAVVAGANSVSITVPDTALAGQTFARFRLSSAGGLAPTGQAADGEVEDYAVQISVPAASGGTVVDDPLNPGERVLVVLGGAGNDNLSVSFKSKRGVPQLTVKLNKNNTTFDATQVGRIVVFGLGGNDSISAGKIPLDAQLHGGDGNDSIVGGGANSIMIGGAGNDSLSSKQGRNVYIGGTGSDSIKGSKFDELLISGSTDFDTNDAALSAILNEWSSQLASHTYAARVANLRDGTGSGDRLNGSFFLTTATVDDDAAVDNLIGGKKDLDWFLARTAGAVLDTLVDRAIATEFVDSI
jgi:hypothetical protein